MQSCRHFPYCFVETEDMCFDHQCSKDCEEKELILRNGLKQNSVHYNPNPNPTSTKLQSCMIQFVFHSEVVSNLTNVSSEVSMYGKHGSSRKSLSRMCDRFDTLIKRSREGAAKPRQR